MKVNPRTVARASRDVAHGFARFLLRGKVVDLAVAVVIGAAAGSLITSFVRDIFTPLISALFGYHEFGRVAFTVNHSRIALGDFLDALISFLVIAAVVYFFVIIPVNRLIENAYFQPPADPAMRKCPECLADIQKAARRCMYCAQPVEPMLADTAATAEQEA
ncbi:MAG: large conductance mechanosensitive channel protein MscL [Vulcanimicrobiaceae bacterium]